MKIKLSEERQGEIYIFLALITWAFFPLLVNVSAHSLPPLLFAGLSFLVAGIFTLIIVILRKKTKDLFNKKALPYMLSGAFFIAGVLFPLLFVAGQKTSAGNMALLGQSEVLFTFLFFGLMGFEKMTTNKILGGLLILAGVILTLFYDIDRHFNIWDFVIILACIFAPIGNYFQQKAVRMVSSFAHICLRNLLIGSILIICGLLFEKTPEIIFSQKNIFLILANGLIAFSISKIFFMESIKRIDVSKALALDASYPAFTVFFAFILLHEIPTINQVIGFFVILIGVYFTTQNNAKWWHLNRKQNKRPDLL